MSKVKEKLKDIWTVIWVLFLGVVLLVSGGLMISGVGH